MIICMLHRETMSFQVSRALFLSGQEFPRTLGLEIFGEKLVEESVMGKSVLLPYH